MIEDLFLLRNWNEYASSFGRAWWIMDAFIEQRDVGKSVVRNFWSSGLHKPLMGWSLWLNTNHLLCTFFSFAILRHPYAFHAPPFDVCCHSTWSLHMVDYCSLNSSGCPGPGVIFLLRVSYVSWLSSVFIHRNIWCFNLYSSRLPQRYSLCLTARGRGFESPCSLMSRAGSLATGTSARCPCNDLKRFFWCCNWLTCPAIYEP
jgi:hypothetical protein